MLEAYLKYVGMYWMNFGHIGPIRLCPQILDLTHNFQEQPVSEEIFISSWTGSYAVR